MIMEYWCEVNREQLTLSDILYWTLDHFKMPLMCAKLMYDEIVVYFIIVY